MKKNAKKIVIGIILVALVVCYYFYLSNREVNNEDKVVANEEVSKLINRNLEGDYYPEFPRDVIAFYSRIVKAYYYTELSDKEIEGLGNQARKLFDAELLEKNPENEFFDRLKDEIKQYNMVERKIHDYTVDKSDDVKTFTFEGKEYARVRAAYLMREKGTLVTVYEEYTLRKDVDGNWKILYWDNYVPSDLEND